MCSLISTVICGSISIYESSRRSEEVAQSVDTLNDLALSELDDFAKFKSDSAYVDSYTDKIAPTLKQTAVHTQGAMSVYIRYNPEFTEPTSGVFYTRDSAESEFQEVEPTDFTMYEPDDLEHVGWYYIPVGNQKPTWMDPYLNSNINVYMISYVVPIFVDGESVGIIGMDIEFGTFTDVLDSAGVFNSGYAFLADGQGNIMYHKVHDVPRRAGFDCGKTDAAGTGNDNAFLYLERHEEEYVLHLPGKWNEIYSDSAQGRV